MAKQKDKFTQYLVIGMVVLVVATGAIFSVVTKPKAQKIDIPAIPSITTENAITFNSDLTGVPNVEIWQDLQCPACRSFEETFDKSIATAIKNKKIKVSYYPLSFIGPESVTLANAVICAADEGKYLPIQSYIYRNQGVENSGIWNVKSILAAGKAVDITSDNFKTCVQKLSKSAIVKAVSAYGSEQKIKGTPTVFVDGKAINPADLKPILAA